MGREQDEQTYSELLRLLTIIRRLYPNFNDDEMIDRMNAAIYDYANEIMERLDTYYDAETGYSDDEEQ